MKLQYFKTDKNGTKYYYDYTCPRCGGAGESDNWYRTGRICYECGGTGKRSNPKIVKEYTPEYQAKLNARRQAKAVELTEQEIVELQRRADESRTRMLENLYNQYGCDSNGHGYAYIGNTYKDRHALRDAGGKWLQTFQMWVCPMQIIVDKAVKVIAIDISDKVDVKNQALGNAYEYLNNLV